jgi:hypothetical protein
MAREVPFPLASPSTSAEQDRQLATPDAPVGIVIKNGAPAPKPVRFWAYLWAADEEAGEDHWHRHIPSEHAA